MEKPMTVPEAAARKLAALQRAADDASALAGSARSAATLLDSQVGDAARVRRIAESQGDEPAELGALESELVKLRALRDQAMAEANTRQGLAHSAQHVSAVCGAWYTEQQRRGRILETVTVEPVKPRRGEDAAALVERLQAEILHMRRELDGLALLPLAREELKAAARAHVAELGQGATPKIDPLTGRVALTFVKGAVMASGNGKYPSADKAAALARYVSYYRVSTQKQGQSGLGLDAQRERVAQHLNGRPAVLVEAFTEVESGRRNDRPELARALAAAKRHKATLIVATMSRLTRDPRVLRGLQDAGVDMVFCDLPEVPPGPIGRLILGVLAHVNEFEAAQTGERTKAALAAAKVRGVVLGNPNIVALAGRGALVNRQKAAQRARNILPMIEAVQRDGAVTLREIAAGLALRGVRTACGGQEWRPAQVARVLRRAPEARAEAA
jgi:DNA invertase Pin-like site-specific DNA recombinase